MEYRTLGRTGLQVSALGFGCGNVGGLLVRALAAERERAVARAIELGINYFDTAPSYGDGQSERNLGQALRAVRASVHVGTKFSLRGARPEEIPGLVVQSVEGTLRRLGVDHVDLLQLHDHIASYPRGRMLGVRAVTDALVPTLEKLVEQGKTRFYGITGIGDTAALLQLVDTRAVATAQVVFNLLNPTAAYGVPAGFPAQDFGRLLLRARDRGLGTIGIRVLAAGALSGSEDRHPIAASRVAPIASSREYASDVRHAVVLRTLVDEGHAESLVEASLRFALSSDALCTALIGFSSIEQVELAAAAQAKGPLSAAALARVAELWARLA